MQIPPLFLVDDDELVLTSLRGLFALESDYPALAFTDPREALSALERKEAGVIISDFLMPVMNGIDFLAAARKIQPDAPRILLTGFADKENAIRAINEVGLYQYMEKPWDNGQLLLAVKNAYEQRSLRRNLEEKIREYDQLTMAHADLSERHDNLECELEMAARVIRGLMPQKWPARPGVRFDSLYRPVRIVGGDFHDLAGGDRRLVVLAADVSGHGVQAALSATLLRAIFQETAMRAEHPVELLTRMNERLHVFMPSGMFAAALLLWCDNDSHSWKVASAGLPSPVVVRRSKSVVEEVPVHGLPLGMLAETPEGCFDCISLQLQPNDTLLVTSDGLLEVRNPEGALFVEAGLKRAYAEIMYLEPSEAMSRLVDLASAFGNGVVPDDISMIAVTATGD